MLKPLIFTAVASLVCCSASALDYKNCRSKLFKEFELTENTGHSKVLARPKGRLLALSHQYEILCPWQIEGDFNGDNRVDWVGVAQKEGKYSLLAYLSGPKKHYLQKIKDYKAFPSDVHLGQTTFHTMYKRSGNKLKSIFPARNVVIENVVDKNATVYGWKNKKLSPIHHYEGDFKLEEVKKNQDDDNPPQPNFGGKRNFN